MKITYNTTGFLNESTYNANLKSFLQQYDDRFPGIDYLHLELEDTNTSFMKNGATEQLYYSSNGKMLKIRLCKWCSNRKPTLFDMYSELRNIFDKAVEEHLKSHQHYLRYAPVVLIKTKNMEIQFDIGLSNKPLAFFAERISASLSKYETRMNNLVIRLADENINERGRNEKICILEARPLGADPVVVTYKAITKEQAVNGAIVKLKSALEKALFA